MKCIIFKTLRYKNKRIFHILCVYARAHTHTHKEGTLKTLTLAHFSLPFCFKPNAQHKAWNTCDH